MSRVLTVAHTMWTEMMRRKDFYVLLLLLGALVFVLTSVNVFGLHSTTRYVADVGLLLAWVFSLVLTVNLVGRQLPTEEQKGTIYPLLAKPLTRGELLIGKWLGGWTAVAGASLAFYGVIVLVMKLRGAGFGPAAFWQAWLLHVMALAIVAALALLLSTRMSFGAAATTALIAVAAAFLIVPRVPSLLVHEKGASATGLLLMYYVLPHFELFDLRQRLVHGLGPAPWSVVLMVMLYGLVYAKILLLLAWYAYRHKRFRRGVQL
ncbi:MAG: ABC transporter permease [Kiritimatiellae bacterium]|nr:ABC transporter permease [Kiritimatiellia bacterium]